MENTIQILREIQTNYRQREKDMLFRHPWFNMAFNYCYAFLLVLFAVSLIWWSGNVYRDRKEARDLAERDRIHAAELVQLAENERIAEEQRQKELEDTIDRWSEAGAKMLWGIRDFRNLYGYTAGDLETYLRCVWNRYLEGKKLTDVETIIFKDGQFTGCYKTNAALPRDKSFAKACFVKFLAEETPACDTSYTFAELTPKGIFLSDTFNADGYVQRWHA